MYKIVQTQEFSSWLSDHKDRTTRIRLSRRLDKAARGNLGDVRPLGGDVWEMREFFGPGWRLYYVHRGKQLIVMLGGGSKSSQSKDIEKAFALSRLLED